MNSLAYNKRLNQIALTLLNENLNYSDGTQALDEFADLCSQLTDINPSPTFQAYSGDIELAQGVAINPQAAAQCVKDYPRSIQFIRGTFTAITQKLAEKKEPLNVLYAGCGPYATQLLPLLTLLPSDRFNITLLDVHPESLLSAQHLISVFGLEHFNIHTVCEDACEYQHDVLLDIVIAEVMQKALEQEPQVMVTANFAHQMQSNGSFVPQSIQVDLYLANVQQEHDQVQGLNPKQLKALAINEDRIHIGSVFELNIKTISNEISKRRVIDVPEIDYLQFDTQKAPIKMPVSLPDVVLMTRIQVFDQHWLEDYETDLCLPKTIIELSELNADQRIDVKYQLGSYPYFMFDLLP